jgi:hypothetical protein
VDDWAGFATGNRGPDPYLRICLGDGVCLLRAGDRLSVHLLLLLGQAAAENAPDHRLDLRGISLDQLGDYRLDPAFMLNPGEWTQNHDFWTGFFNPQFIPQTIARTGGSMLLASLYVYLHAAIQSKRHNPELMTLISYRSTRPGLLGAMLVTLGGIWWFLALPESSRASLAAASTLNIMMMVIFAATILVFVMLYLGPPGWIISALPCCCTGRTGGMVQASLCRRGA